VEIQGSRVIARILNTGSLWGKNFRKLYRIFGPRPASFAFASVVWQSSLMGSRD
jgi:hypothetical protein